MTETQQRFLKAIAERVPGDNVAEVRLYPTLRVGPVESGVAIVATRDVPPAAEDQVAPVSDEQGDQPRTATGERDRLSILTAHFRHTVKGPDRGKWEFSMVHDADAPIETIESVVRGVARRAGEDGEPELLSADEFQRALVEPWWTAPAS
ncbi:MAG TPA: hypothetical protein VFZ73_06070 [Gemmatimonadaceae bacterium]